MPETLLERIAAGDRGAVGQCLDRYGGLVWSLSRRMLGESPEAEDAVQEIFTEIWRHAGRFDAAKGREVTFVATIARRRLIDRRRALGRAPETVPLAGSDEIGERADPGAGAERTDAAVDAARVHQALAHLRPEQRQVLELCVVEGLSHGETAERTGLPLGTVKSHARRGLMRLRELLESPSGAREAPA